MPTTYSNKFTLSVYALDTSVSEESPVIYHVYDASGIPDELLPTSYDSNRHTRKIAYRTMNGDYTSRLLSSHRKIVWKFEALTEEQYYKLVEAKVTGTTTKVGGIYGIQEALNSDIFVISAIDTDSGKLSTIFGGCRGAGSYSRFYLGEDTKFEFIGVADGTRYYSGEIHWIEATGHHYDDPLINNSNTNNTDSNTNDNT